MNSQGKGKGEPKHTDVAPEPDPLRLQNAMLSKRMGNQREEKMAKSVSSQRTEYRASIARSKTSKAVFFWTGPGESRKEGVMRDKNISSLFEWIVKNEKEAELQDAEKEELMKCVDE